MRKNNKKGFTLVELLVVIAIVAILATVSVVAYLSFTEKAKDSNDQVLVKQLNTVLQADESINGKPSTMHDAVNILDKHGFVVEKLTPTSTKNEFVYDVTTNRFEVWKVDEVTNGTPNANKWVVVKDEVRLNEITDQYSVYLASTFTETDAPDNKLTVQNGFDAGLITTAFDVTYNNTLANKSTVMHTNAGTLTLNGSDTDNVTHYGEASIVDVNKVGMNSYHVNGKVSQINLKYGRVAVEVKAEVNEVLVLEGVDLTKIKINISSKVTKVPTIVNGTNGNLDVKDENNNVIPNLEKPIQATYVSTVAELDKALVTDFAKYVILKNDINTIDINYPGYLCTGRGVIINGNGHKLYGHRKDKAKGDYHYNATLTLTHWINGESGLNVTLQNIIIENDVINDYSSCIAINTSIDQLTMNNVTLINKGKNASSVNVVSSQNRSLKINLSNCNGFTTDSSYFINTNRPLLVNANNVDIKSWCFVKGNSGSKNSTYNIYNSNIDTPNNHSSEASNDFGVFTLYNDSSKVNLHNVYINGLSKNTAKQFVFFMNGYTDANNYSFTISGNSEVYGRLYGINYGSKKINAKSSITGGIFNVDPGKVPNGYKVIRDKIFYKVVPN